MQYINKNFQNMEEYRPALYEKIKEKYDAEKFNFDRFNLVETRDGSKTVEIIDEEKKIRLNSIYSPKKEAERWIKQYNFENISSSVVMFGVANGIFANTIIENTKDDAVIILVEPDIELFLYCLENFDFEQILSDSRVHLFIDTINDDNLYFGFFDYISDAMLPNQVICIYPGMEKLYKAKARKFLDTIEKCYSVELSLAFGSQDIFKMGIINLLKNLHFIKESNYLTEFIGKVPDNVPVIIAAAGPSLDKNIDELKRVEGKAFIIATDTAVKSFISHNVHYDVIIIKDARKSISHLSDERCFNHPIIADIKARNSILEMNHGRKIWNNTSDFLCNLYSKYGLGYTSCMLGGSVATDAFTVAEIIGAKRIVLIGQDLAYAGEYTHANGVANHVYDEINGVVDVEDIYGNMIKSRGDWVDMLDWFKSEIATLNGKIDVIDATEGGAKIQGTRIMKLSEVIDNYCTGQFDFDMLLKSMPATFSAEKYSLVKNDLLDLKIELNEITECAKEGIEISDYMLLNLETQSRDEVRKTMAAIKEKIDFIEKQFVYIIISDYVETRMKNSIFKINMLSQNDEENIRMSYELSKNAFEAILETVDFAMPILEEALEKI